MDQKLTNRLIAVLDKYIKQWDEVYRWGGGDRGLSRSERNIYEEMHDFAYDLKFALQPEDAGLGGEE